MTQVPPHNTEAEEAVLGSAMLGARDTLFILQSDDFYDESHRVIYGVMVGLVARGGGVDPITVGRQLQSEGALEKVGGLPYLHTLVAMVPTPANARHYARIVFEYGTLRRIITAATNAADVAYGTPDSGGIEQLLRDIGTAFREIVARWKQAS